MNLNIRQDNRADFALFALWKDSLPFQNQLKEFLKERFELVFETEVEWSEKYFHENCARLYENPIYTTKEKFISINGEKIGDRRFLILIVKDNTPVYTYAKSVSGKIELSNTNITQTKYPMRDLVKKETGKKYAIHSTNSLSEFFYQAPLLLGVDLFKKIIEGKSLKIPFLKKDLEGAGGWKNYEQFFEILNISCNYLVQRGFETLPNQNEDMDIDFLTNDFQKLASTIGAQQSFAKPYKGFINVNNKKINVDIRFTGDRYYNTIWQKDMLENKTMSCGVYRPCDDDYFFSLLFHCKAQKPSVKEKYYGILNNLAEQLHYDWFDVSMLNDDQACGYILRGYFQGQGYFYERPIDKDVFINENIVTHLPSTQILNTNRGFKNRVKNFMKHYLPKEALLILVNIKNRI